ncbi:diguanylate cyclase [Sphingosinicella rhizophila]|uniref:diguanylate cyclase n=1 Tax=Sphingosinicella rhizophila TaxID=3050082 RepID=A0ABU3Q6B3_9SPHN|nr:diguanylate cyclase [Sphingosinicella sp. GR2756]MDT9598946.1 diguanylate cyclase [Sphingosinicella sp. GR2756]
MRIATITNWAYGVSVGLALISGTTMLLASNAEDRERAAVQQRIRFETLTVALVEDSFRMTEQAQLYVINQDPSHLIAYRHDAADLKSVEDRIVHLRDVGAQPAELEALRKGLRGADLLMDEQKAAIDAIGRGDAETARRILFGAEYQRDLERVDNLIARFQFLLGQRMDAAMTQAMRASQLLRTISEIVLGITVALFLFVLFFVIRQRILRPVVRLSDVVTRLARQDFAVDPPEHDQIDEIGDMTQAIRIFRENGLELQRLERERAADGRMRDLLGRMTQRLQGCDTMEDLAEIVSRFATEIAPAYSGRLYVHRSDRDVMAEACSWQQPLHSPPEFAPTHCWALRRGQLHRSGGGQIDIPCLHIDGATRPNASCVPLAAQGETIGLLYFEQHEAEVEAPAIADVYVELIAETVSLALANLRLRDALRKKALVDPLTGLLNRHQLEDMFNAHVANAQRRGEPLSCIMMDVDHFKRFNDRFGHDAGDEILRAVGSILANATREVGTAFRYGGEEFLLLLPQFALDQAENRCADVRERIRKLSIQHEGRMLGPITASFGIAGFPNHGSADALLRTADAALLRAKEQGRDRIVIATERGAEAAA